jgi:hypothetical protein
VYLLLFLVGSIGFTAMVALGFLSHTAGDHGGTHHSLGHGSGHGGSHGLLGHDGHHLPVHTKSATVNHSHGSKSLPSWFALSPLDIFSFCLGAGATGILAASVLPAPALAIASAIGALAFNFAIVKPLMALLLRFATKPSEGLEGSVAKSVEAVTRFDSQGQGLVRLTLDGQNVQLLARLEAAEVTGGTTVAKGDQLVILAVDPHRNTCTVTRELAV